MPASPCSAPSTIEDHGGGGHELRTGSGRRRRPERRPATATCPGAAGGGGGSGCITPRIATLRSASKAGRSRTARRRATRRRSASRPAPASAARHQDVASLAHQPRHALALAADDEGHPALRTRRRRRSSRRASPSRPTTVNPASCRRSSARGMLATRACGRCSSAPADARIAAGVTSAARRVRVTSTEAPAASAEARGRAEVLRIRDAVEDDDERVVVERERAELALPELAAGGRRRAVARRRPGGRAPGGRARCGPPRGCRRRRRRPHP